MIDPKYLQFGKNTIERIYGYSNEIYIAFHNKKLLNIGKIGYKRRGDLVSALARAFAGEIYHDICKTSGSYGRQNWRDAERMAKEVIEEMIKDNIIEIKCI